MTKLIWHKDGDRFFETGVSKGVLFVYELQTTDVFGYSEGVAWNGLTAVNENPTGAETTSHYADNKKYASITSAEEFGATIEAFTYPVEFEACDGYAQPAPGISVGQQPRKSFGFAYRTEVGNDEEGTFHAYKIHVVWGAKAAPSEKAHATINETPEPATFSWEVTAVGVETPGFTQPVASVTFDSRELSAANMQAVEDALYGDDTDESSLPTPAALLALAGYTPAP